MIPLHHAPSTAAMAPHMVLEERGVPFTFPRLVRVLARSAVQRVFARECLAQPQVGELTP